jgi:hypothetical protein
MLLKSEPYAGAEESGGRAHHRGNRLVRGKPIQVGNTAKIVIGLATEPFWRTAANIWLRLSLSQVRANY